MVAVLGASVLASLDLFIVNLAFPRISRSFAGASAQELSWVLNAYGVAFAALLAPAGRIADRLGRRTVFQAGLAVFTLGSLAAVAAPGVAALIAARAVQGVGAAVIVPTSLALLLSSAPEDRHKRMVSVWAATGSVAAALGPALGGLLTEIDWRWVFAINLPIGMVALLFSRRLGQAARTGGRAPDLVGSLMLAVSVGALVTALSYWTEWTPASGWLWTALAISAAAFGVFVVRCRTHPVPAINLAVFRSMPFTAAAVGMAAFYVGFSIMLLGGTLWVTNVWYWSPAMTGLAFIVGPGTAVATALGAGRAKLDPRWFAAIGGALFLACGAMWSAALSAASPSPSFFLAGLVLTGAGAGVAQTGFLAGASRSLPNEEYAAGTGVINTARQIGATLGVAILITIVTTGDNPTAYPGAWTAMGAAGALAAATTLTFLIRSRSPKTVDEPATEIAGR
ncbi:Membrane protein [Sinomonas atrocyanea]|uniref:Membrane protein n=2 Tax=Sinomonas atrocyanea TaxID=37927 RepID=A0A127A1I9_9MICC|nr:Membrane protein [Sinomonas atrocyanea]GEB65077.1 MFS transporter [Sinomonas atrocyanea]GGG63273.1 MFS transporter [Sinomonas atrocyanea]